jgi:hypothetical protein
VFVLYLALLASSRGHSTAALSSVLFNQYHFTARGKKWGAKARLIAD